MDEPVAVFDFGTRGCGDGVAADFKRYMSQVELGQVIEVVVRDPSARTDLPAMSRMLGHDLLREEEVDGAVRMRFKRSR